jgi:hypothetical protein
VIVRRLAALATAMLLLRLNFVAVDLTCAQHDPANAATSGHAVGHDHHASVLLDDADSRVNPSESCDVPVRSDCCQALASCSVTIGSGIVTRDDPTLRDRATLFALGVDRPSSRRDAPDPPPPKA